MHQGRKSVGHPVDVASGTMYATHEDISIPGRVELVWDRRYSTALLDMPPTPLGPGWTTRYFATLTQEDDEFQFLTPEGEVEIFVDSENMLDRGGIIRNLGTFQELVKIGNRYLVTRWEVNSGKIERYVFHEGRRGETWPLACIEDGTGQGLDLLRDATGRLQSIRQRRENRWLILEYNSSNQITTVSLDLPHSWPQALVRYEYDSSGRLSEAYNALGYADRYEYDAASQMTREILKGGGTFYFKYDEQGRCIRTSGLDRFDEKTFHFLDHVQWTEVTDSLGNVGRYQWDASGQIMSEVSPLGAERLTQYDEYGRVTAEIDALGGQMTYLYDDAGNQVEMTLPDGAIYKSQYNEHHRVTRVSDPLGAEWNFAYDSQQRLTTITHPTGAKWYQHWNEIGDVVAVEYSTDGVWRYSYNQLGQVTQITDRSGASEQFEYDEKGALTRIIHASGEETCYQRDAAGQLVRVDFPDGSTTLNTYDSAGNLTKTTHSNGAVTTYRYGQCCEQILEIQSSDGGRMQYIWGSEPDRLDAIVDEKGERYSFEYNNDGYLIRETFPNGRTISYVRNVDGDVVECTNGAGETTRYKRDAVGRILAATFFDGSQVRFDYNARGLVVCATNASTTVQFERDLSGRRIKESSDQYSIESRYDIVGNRIARRSSLGAETTYAYDARGNLVQIGLSPSCQIRIERDAAGREVWRHLSERMVLGQSYDPLDRLTEQWLTTPNATFRGTGSPLSSTTIHRCYRYSTSGNVREIWDSGWGTTAFHYDLAGRLMQRVTNDAGEKFDYDANGNVTSVTRTYELSPGNSTPGINSTSSVTVNRHIGVANQVLRNGDTVFEYDGDGRLIRKIQGQTIQNSQVWEYKWNAMGLLAEVLTPSGQQWRYTYDAFGRRIRKEGPGVDTRYVWDGNAILHEIPSVGDSFSTWAFWPTSFAPIAKQEREKTYFAINDHLGTPRELVDEQGRIAWSAQLTAWGQLDSLKSSQTECHIRFQGQWFDPESGLHYNNCRYYDPDLGSFISMDPVLWAGDFNGYRYAINPLNWIDPHGLAPEYYLLDKYGRPTGAFAEVTKSDLRKSGTSPPTFDPPGWKGGQHPHHQQRSHLIADSFGGSGSDPRNLVTLTDGSNNPGMSKLEGIIRKHVKAGNTVLMEVRVNYAVAKTPKSVSIYAIDQDGKVIVDDTVTNGKRQKMRKLQCC